jgi:hypothetical protein
VILQDDGTGTPPFYEPAGSALPVGNDPVAIDVRDLDDDRDLDMISSNFADDTVTVILNLGDGNFAAGVALPVEDQPIDLATGDLDGNGSYDIIACNVASDTVSVILNTGGVFDPQQSFAVGTVPVSVDAADLDGDGDDDLAVVAVDAMAGPSVQVLENNIRAGGGFGFEPPVAFSVEADPNFVVSVDLNNDGLDDLVTVNEDDGKSGGSVTALISDPVSEPCPSDLNGNGQVDFADVIALIGQWGDCPPPGEPCPGDLNGDGVVGFADVLIVIGGWGACP